MTLVSVDRGTLAEELWPFGEDALYLAPLQMSDEDMIRLWLIAGRLYLKAKPAPPVRPVLWQRLR